MVTRTRQRCNQRYWYDPSDKDQLKRRRRTFGGYVPGHKAGGREPADDPDDLSF